jgi:hypothetical protein
MLSIGWYTTEKLAGKVPENTFVFEDDIFSLRSYVTAIFGKTENRVRLRRGKSRRPPFIILTKAPPNYYILRECLRSAPKKQFPISQPEEGK